MSKADSLFKPLKVGSITLNNRIVMAAMTRMRCNPADCIPNELLVEYYSQRATAGLILTECSHISNRSVAFPGAGGIFNDEQANGWKKVVDAVHAKGGKIVLQIWHAGRAAQSSIQGGLQPLAPSAIAIRGKSHFGAYDVPQAMTQKDIDEVLQQFYDGAVRAKKAGFDGLELHGANGYIVDQFLKNHSNKRTDQYGGSVENRCRFALEAIDRLIQVFGADKVGIKVSPIGRYNDQYDSNPVELYTHLFKELAKKNIAFIEIMNNKDAENHEDYGHPASRDQVPDLYKKLRPHYKGVIIGNVGLTAETAAQGINDGDFDAASFATLYLGNPDLVKRFRNNLPLAQPDWGHVYAGGAVGYTDQRSYDSEIIYKPIKVGNVDLRNRFVMAAMTRLRADAATKVPNDLMVQYYSQRATAGLILTECAQISKRSLAYPTSPGIYNDDQVAGWKKVTDAVHAKGGKIFLQIWHAGRAALSINQEGQKPLAPSPIAIRGKSHQGPYEVPQEMTQKDIDEVLQQFHDGAVRAKKAGFDGVELHGANGYLVDQFLRSNSNKRTDNYGGSVENRSRFALQALDKLIQVFGAGNVGIKLTPIGRYLDMFDSNPIELYKYLLEEIDKRQIAFIELGNSTDPNNYEEYGFQASRDQVPDLYKQLRPHFKGIIIGNCGIKPEQAISDINDGLYDVASYGQLYIGNPDLVARIQNNGPINQPDWATVYGGNAKGYTDYPFFRHEASCCQLM